MPHIMRPDFFNLNQSNYAQAERMFKKAIAINPANHKSYVDLGQCYILQGQYQQAIEVYKLGYCRGFEE
jgi:tetratricopeptide (TPR) repeat protein